MRAAVGEHAAGPTRGAFQRRNFALARVAAEAYLAAAGIARARGGGARGGRVGGRRGAPQVLGEDPLTVLDGAHNPDAVSALVESLPELLDTPAGTRPLALVMGVLEDKDAASMLRQLLPLCARAWFTAPPSSRALSPAALESLARQLGFEAVTCEPRPRRALAQAQAWARAYDGGPPAPAVLATGSVYLVGDLLAAAREQAGSQAQPRARADGGGGDA